MSEVWGTVAALVAPLLMAIGFTLWDVFWTGSAMMLNALKCSVASILFAAAVAIVIAAGSTPRSEEANLWLDAMMLVVSGVIGIVIGDSVWLKSLQMIGARRVILVDSIKPFIAAVLAVPIFDEPIRPLGIVGMLITMIAVVVVSLESENEQSTETRPERSTSVQTSPDNRENRAREETDTGEELAFTSSYQIVLEGEESSRPNLVEDVETDEVTAREQTETRKNSVNKLARGYMLSALNVILDVFGSILTKMYGQSFNTFEIAGIRFGSSSLLLVGMILASRSYARSARRPETTSGNKGAPWWEFPQLARLHLGMVLLGVVSTTFLSPTLQNYALFQIPLAVFSTLMSLTPIWALPIVFFLKGEKSSLRAIVGSVVAVAGVIPLYFSF